MKKIAIPTHEGMVDDHFGHCEYYTIVSLNEKNKVEKMEPFDSPKGCGCKSDIANTLKQMGVTQLLAGNMGQGALNKIQQSGIEVIRGCSGDIEQLLRDYTSGKLADSGLSCASHEQHHASGFSLSSNHVCGHHNH